MRGMQQVQLQSPLRIHSPLCAVCIAGMAGRVADRHAGLAAAAAALPAVMRMIDRLGGVGGGDGGGVAAGRRRRLIFLCPTRSLHPARCRTIEWHSNSETSCRREEEENREQRMYRSYDHCTADGGSSSSAGAAETDCGWKAETARTPVRDAMRCDWMHECRWSVHRDSIRNLHAHWLVSWCGRSRRVQPLKPPPAVRVHPPLARCRRCCHSSIHALLP